ncbi:MAG: MmcQ/YjbR family DNA-binding protein [Blastocatellia bacterium]
MTTKRSSAPARGKPLDAAQVRERVIAIIETLPEAIAEDCGGKHLSLEVRGKRFGWYMDDHHGDGRLAINCRAPVGESQALADSAPEKFHIPKYVGHRGWVGMWLDIPRLDWAEVEGVLVEAYLLTAPKKLVMQLQQRILNTD